MWGSNFAPGIVLAELDNVKNIGYADTLNDVPEAFFTLDQDDPKVTVLRTYAGRAHVHIFRNDDLVWAGWFGMEVDSNERDVVFTCYGYLAGFYWMTSNWNVQYTNAQIDTIVSDLWTRVKTTLTYSLFTTFTTGTIQAPVTTSGGATPISLPNYQMFYKRGLFVLKELAAVAMSDTSNRVVFEITHSATPTFNLWKNKTTAQTNTVWKWGDNKVKGFRDYQMPIYHRNDLQVVGSNPTQSVLRASATDSTDMSTDQWGRRMEPVYLQYVRDSTELDRVSKLRLNLALREQTDLSLNFFPNAVLPPLATGAGFAMGDTVTVKITRGITSIDTTFLVVGYRVITLGGAEYMRVQLQQPPA
jgi:hypothetical protein